MTQEIFIKELQHLPDHLKQEVLDFLLFLKSKYGQQTATTPPLEKPSAKAKPESGSGKYNINIAPDLDKSILEEPKQEIPPGEKPKPYFGCGSVKGWISQDFDETLEDFKEYME